MKKIVDNPGGVPAPLAGRYSHVVRLEISDSTILVLSGQCALDEDLNVVAPNDIRGQSERIFEIIGTILEAHGATFADIVNIRTYLTDMDDRAQYGEVRRRFLPVDQLPASTTVEVSALFLPEAVVEIEVLAALHRTRD